MLFYFFMSGVFICSSLFVLCIPKAKFMSGNAAYRAEYGEPTEFNYSLVKLVAVGILVGGIVAGLQGYRELQRQQKFDRDLQEMKQFDRDFQDPTKRQQLIEKMKKKLDKQ
jgi:cytochrome c-type biogenesis protein CcmH/NrfG